MQHVWSTIKQGLPVLGTCDLVVVWCCRVSGIRTILAELTSQVTSKCHDFIKMVSCLGSNWRLKCKLKFNSVLWYEIETTVMTWCLKFFDLLKHKIPVFNNVYFWMWVWGYSFKKSLQTTHLERDRVYS